MHKITPPYYRVSGYFCALVGKYYRLMAFIV